MSFRKILTTEFKSFSKPEIIFFAGAIFTLAAISIYLRDLPSVTVSAVFGILYTVFAGKGKVFCYFFGIIGTLACAYVSFRLYLFGYFVLHLFYYFPMEIIGFVNWSRNLEGNSNNVIKTKLTAIQAFQWTVAAVVLSFAAYIILLKLEGSSPIIDALVLVLSVIAMILTVKRCAEQWFAWTVVNFCTVLMWFNIFAQGERAFGILAVRVIYLVLGVYFFIKWKRELSASGI